MRIAFPGRSGVFQSNSQRRHAFGFESSSNFASLQVDPPSALTSTFAIVPLPVQAAPDTRTFEFAESVSPSAGFKITTLVWISESAVSSLKSPRLFQYE